MEYIITNTGSAAMEMFEEHGIVVLFDDSAPEELAEISVTHTGKKNHKPICVGDILQISGSDYLVTAVGEDANRTLKAIGHATLKFTGKNKVDLPGQIELKGEQPPKFVIGEKIKVIYNR